MAEVCEAESYGRLLIRCNHHPSYGMLFVSQGSCDYPLLRVTIEVHQGWGNYHCENDLQGNRRLSPVAIIVVSVCVVSNALCVNTIKRAFNTCVCLHPTGLRGNRMILHTFLNLGWRISSMQSAQWRISSKHPFHEQQYSIITTSMKDRAEGIVYYSAS